MGIRKSNGYHRKKRGAETRKRKGVVLVVAEGKNKTETNYLKAWSGKGYVIKFVPDTATDPVNMIKALKKEYDNKDLDSEFGDMAFCLVDHDGLASKDVAVKKADKLAAEYGIKVLVSNPCFEVWFLCHYTYSTKQYSSSNEVINELRQFDQNYDKADCKTVLHLISKTEKAICNAKKLEAFCESNGRNKHTHDYMPSTEVYELIELLTT